MTSKVMRRIKTLLGIRQVLPLEENNLMILRSSGISDITLPSLFILYRYNNLLLYEESPPSDAYTACLVRAGYTLSPSGIKLWRFEMVRNPLSHENGQVHGNIELYHDEWCEGRAHKIIIRRESVDPLQNGKLFIEKLEYTNQVVRISGNRIIPVLTMKNKSLVMQTNFMQINLPRNAIYRIHITPDAYNAILAYRRSTRITNTSLRSYNAMRSALGRPIRTASLIQVQEPAAQITLPQPTAPVPTAPALTQVEEPAAQTVVAQPIQIPIAYPIGQGSVPPAHPVIQPTVTPPTITQARPTTGAQEDIDDYEALYGSSDSEDDGLHVVRPSPPPRIPAPPRTYNRTPPSVTVVHTNKYPQHIINTFIESCIAKNTECPFELEPLTKETTAITPCGHAATYSAMVRWIEGDDSCPVCRRPCSKNDLMTWKE